MKKTFVILTMGALLGASISSQATICCKKHHHKQRVCCMKRRSCCPEPPASQKELTLSAEPQPITRDPNFNFFERVSGSMAFTTNYVFRGISQTNNLPALQGGLTYTFPIGIYLNAWGSNVKFANSTASIEIDTILGIHRTVGENFIYDINIDRYNYPGRSASSYNELNTLFNYRFFQAGVSYSPNVYNTHRSGLYINGGINYHVPEKFAFTLKDVTLIALLGRYKLGAAAGNSYTDYNVALNKKLSDIYSLGVQWASTNGQTRNRPYDRDLFIGTFSANF